MIQRVWRKGIVIGQVVTWPVLFLGVGWGTLALGFDGPAVPWLGEGLVAASSSYA